MWLPWHMQFCVAMIAVLPTWAGDLATALAGGWGGMDGYTGRVASPMSD